MHLSTIAFFRQFLCNPGQTGAVAPSSTGLASLIADSGDLESASVVIEFGSGTGVLTECILAKLAPRADFFAMEINPLFAELTQRRCPGARVVRDSAVNARRYLDELGHAHCDRIVCGLPWASFPEPLQKELLETILDVLPPGGRFLTFAYLQGLLLPAGQRFRRRLKANFSRVTTTRTIWRNLPPAFVYCAER